jgi:hypothetical protein
MDDLDRLMRLVRARIPELDAATLQAIEGALVDGRPRLVVASDVAARIEQALTALEQRIDGLVERDRALREIARTAKAFVDSAAEDVRWQ